MNQTTDKTNIIVHQSTDEKTKDSVLELRKQFIDIINQIIEINEWDQKKAAAVLGVNQPRVSNLTSCHVSKFSLEFLIKSLMRIGYNFSFELESKVEKGEDKPPRLALIIDSDK